MTTLSEPARRLTFKDLAQRWGKSVRTVERWTAGLRRVAFSKRSIEFEPAVIEKYEKSCNITPAKKKG